LQDAHPIINASLVSSQQEAVCTVVCTITQGRPRRACTITVVVVVVVVISIVVIFAVGL
jgi:hypothetical protein